MADDRHLTPEQKERALKWLGERAPHLECPSCGNKTFDLVDHLVTSIPFSDGNFYLGEMAFPTFLAVCERCAFVLSYSAAAAGVIDSPDSSDEGGEK